MMKTTHSEMLSNILSSESEFVSLLVVMLSFLLYCVKIGAVIRSISKNHVTSLTYEVSYFNSMLKI